ncbi:MAG: DUF883 family protein [Allorhizobium sp.]
MATISAAEKVAAKTNGEDSTAEIQMQLEQLSKDVAALTQAIADFGNMKVQSATERATRLSNEVMDASTEALYAAKNGIVSAEKDLETQIRNKPLQSVGIAAGVGFLAALLMRR